MAKKKPKPREPEPVPATTERTRSGMPIHAWIDEVLGEAFKGYLHSMDVRITATSAIEVALKEFLVKRGFWPPRTSSTDD